MAIPRFFGTPQREPAGASTGRVLLISGDELHHLRDVLRLQRGDRIELIDRDSSTLLACSIVSIQETFAEVSVISELPSIALPPLTLFAALITKDCAELIVEKCTELGVSSFAFFLADRSQGAALSKHEEEKRRTRLARISEAALKQSGFHGLPRFSFHATLAAALKKQLSDKSPSTYSLRYVLDLPAAQEPLHSLPDLLQVALLRQEHGGIVDRPSVAPSPSQANHLQQTEQVVESYLIVGPEGGLTTTEVEEAVRFGFTRLSLGPKILRSETAAIVGSALLLNLLVVSQPDAR